ncbi:MAG: DUF1592 domain-containing protein, partial [Salinibacterium sp.]|nr:DUF1592 domain-containing protein [Salinibacterium sp.]
MDSTIESAVGDGDVARLYSRGSVEAPFQLPRDGVYRLRVSAYAQQAGPDIARMALTIGAQPTEEWEIPEGRSEPGLREIELRLPAGRNQIALSFVNDYYNEDHPDPKQRDRNLFIDWLEVIGPIDRVAPTLGEAWIFAADPGRGSVRHRTHAVLEELLSRLWRRPARSAEVRRLAQISKARLEDGENFRSAIRSALTAALASPSFVFRLEPGGKGRGHKSVELDDFEVATRLSYFLWSSAPDDTLRRRARRGELQVFEILVAETRRMLADERADALALNFAAQWLELRNLEDAQPDADAFPEFDEALRRSMARESELLFETVLRERRDIRELLTADYSHYDERLARHYGAVGAFDTHFRRVDLIDGPRRGLLGHAG